MKPILFVDFYRTLNHEIYWRSLPLDLHKKVEEFLFVNKGIDWETEKLIGYEKVEGLKVLNGR